VHLSATAIWIGGLLITMLLVWPSMKRSLQNNPALYRTLADLRKRFYPISNLCLAALIVTGLFQMTADPNYNGLLTFDTTWSQVMLAKHAVIVGMALAGIVLQYVVAPELERVSLLLERDKGDPAQTESRWQALRRREVWLTWLNGALGVAVLGFSAWATSI
jgi:putative copper export protein